MFGSAPGASGHQARVHLAAVLEVIPLHATCRLSASLAGSTGTHVVAHWAKPLHKASAHGVEVNIAASAKAVCAKCVAASVHHCEFAVDDVVSFVVT